MKNKEIANICKTTNVIYKGMYDGVQWVGTGFAMYPLFDLPIMENSQLLNFFDVDKESQQKYKFAELNDKITELFDNSNTEEYEITYSGIVLLLGRSKFAVYQTENQNCVFVNPDLLKPFKNISDGYSLYLRKFRVESEIQNRIVVKKGLLNIGLILPLEISNNYVDIIQNLADTLKQKTITTHEADQVTLYDE